MPSKERALSDSEITNAVEASSVENIQRIVDSLHLNLAKEHQIWCHHVWKTDARFAVLPGRLPGKGMGIIATRDIESGEQIAHIPQKLLYTTNSIPASVKKKYPRLTGHGLLAAGLMYEVFKNDSPYRVWIETWPTMQDLETSMPLLLPVEYRGPLIDTTSGEKFFLLPPAISGVWIDSSREVETRFENAGNLPKQEGKLNQAASTVQPVNLSEPHGRRNDLSKEETFKWMWLMVNTRSFYYDLPLRTKPKSTADMMCLCPFLDYFNHDDKGCNVSYNDQGFTVTADRSYKKGEEVVISYGAHSNDLLWTDYGFLLDNNSSDSVCIDAWVLDPSTRIAESQNQRLLEDAGYWRNYSLTRDGPCYRTEMAIRSQTLSRANWQRMVGGEAIRIAEDKIERDTTAFLVEKILKPCIEKCMLAESAIRYLDGNLPSPMVHFALSRWKQIRLLAEDCARVK